MTETTTRSPVGTAAKAALAGVLAAAAALTTASLADALFEPVPSLIAVVDQTIIRILPGNLVRLGVESAGTADKPLLTFGTVVIALVLGAWLGMEARRRRIVGDVTIAAFGLLGVLCAVYLDTVSVAGTVVAAVLASAAGIVTLHVLLAALDRDVRPAGARAAPSERGTGATAEPAGPRMPGTFDRRNFLVAGSMTAAAAAVVFAGSKGLRRSASTSGQRAAIRLPSPAQPASVPAGGVGDAVSVEGLSPLTTPTKDFYRIDEALVVPRVDVDSWRLQVKGMVDAPYELTFDELLAMPLVERDITLSCVSNEVGGGLVGNARWLGVRLADLLERARVQPRADQLVGRSVDRFTVGFPTGVALDGRDAMVAVAQNGEPLTAEHGFPARLVVPGLYGYVSATKWLKEIELTRWDAFDAYWIERSWAKEAPVKLQSRIDVPRDHSRAPQGTRPVAGVAWAPNRGIAKVEVRLDEGPWWEARLGPSLGDDSWRQWVSEWDARPGNHTLQVRATTNDGEVQTPVKLSPFPDGATGHHEVNVRVVDRR